MASISVIIYWSCEIENYTCCLAVQFSAIQGTRLVVSCIYCSQLSLSPSLVPRLSSRNKEIGWVVGNPLWSFRAVPQL